MIRSLVGSDLSEELASKIVNRTDGIPLFVEELTRTILSSRSESGGMDENIDIPGRIP
jgi:predicted ATPase